MKKLSSLILMTFMLSMLFIPNVYAAQNSVKQAAAVYADIAPTIDGITDEMWSKCEPVTNLENYYLEGMNVETNETISLRFMWNADYLYVLAEVITPDGIHVDNAAAYQNDGVAIFLDEDNTVLYNAISSVQYGDYTAYYFNVVADGSFYNTDNTVPAETIEKFKYATKVNGNNYTIKYAIPWVKLNPKAGTKVGLDIEVEVNIGNGLREARLNWADTTANSYRYLDSFGELALVESETVTPTVTTIANTEIIDTDIVAPKTNDAILILMTICALLGSGTVVLSKIKKHK